jgi:hypothetical protein
MSHISWIPGIKVKVISAEIFDFASKKQKLFQNFQSGSRSRRIEMANHRNSVPISRIEHLGPTQLVASKLQRSRKIGPDGRF